MLNSNHRLTYKARVVLLFTGVVLLILNLFTIEFNQLISRINLGAGLRIITNILIITAMVISIRHTGKNNIEE